MTRKLRFGIVGAGVITPSHARAIRDHAEDAELAAICDIQVEKAKKLAAEFGAQRVYADYEQMLKQDDIDVIDICLPSGLHAKFGIAAARAGKHVLCEKPLDISLENIDALIKACRDHRVKLGTIYQRRTMPQAVLARKAVQEGKLGRMVLGDAYLKYYRSPEYYRSAGWRGTWELDGGGALMNQGVHGIDLIQWMMGDVESVFARSAPLVRDIPVEDTAVAVLKYKNGAFGVIQGATSVYPEQQTRFELHGENGTVIFDDKGFRQWKFLNSEEEAPALPDQAALASGHTVLVGDMIEAIREDREPMVNGPEARKAVELIMAIYESARTGSEVVLGSL